MFFRKRYNRYLAVILTLMSVAFVTQGMYFVSAILFAIAWLCCTVVDDNPTNIISVWQMVKEVLRMLPVQVIAVSVIWVAILALYEYDWILYIFVTVWFFGSFFVPVWVTKNKNWYIDNHLFVSAGYFALCIACWVWIGPLSIEMVSVLFNL